MKSEKLCRGFFYILGMLILALGLTLNTKAGLGVSAIISVPYCISEITNTNFGDMTFIAYVIFVIVEMILHYTQPEKFDRKRQLILDVLQIPISLLFTRVLNIYEVILPDYSTGGYGIRLFILILAIVLTGIGAAMTLNMRLVPNPGDGIVQAVADTINRRVGFTKNCFDLCCFLTTLCIGFVFTHSIVGVGIGTLCAVIGVGRCIWLFNNICQKPLKKVCGLK